VTYFDLEELPESELPQSHRERIANPTQVDAFHKFCLHTFRGRSDWRYITRTLQTPNELLVVGKIDFNKDRFTMRPRMFIQSDRTELYEYWGRKTETRGITNRNWLKFAIGCTALHFLVVRVPSLFSMYFGDAVGETSKKLGAEDNSSYLAQREVAKLKPREGSLSALP